jgi:S1-C subfamily serine protease
MSPGLGGGPLLDRFGRVAGIVSLNLNEIGRFALAIPSECYLDQEQAFLSGGPRGMGARAWLGIFCYTVNGHVVVAGVLPGGPGDGAGLRSGDVVVAVDGRELADRASFYRWLWERAPGAPVSLRIARGGETRGVVVPSGDPVAFFAQ